MTVKDYPFKINILVGDLEREECSPPSTTTVTTMVALTSPASARAPLRLRRWGSSGGDYLCLINLFLY
jgi:hypothetical protein